MWWNVLLTFWSKRKSNNRLAADVYQTVVKASRDPFLFKAVRLPDNPQGRFESVVLHMFLFQRRLRGVSSSALLAQALMDKMADDLDRSIREMGVGDLSVGKNVKNLLKLAERRFYLYESCFDRAQEMSNALRTVFSVGVTPQQGVEIDLLNIYVASLFRQLNEYRDVDIVNFSFSLPESSRGNVSGNG